MRTQGEVGKKSITNSGKIEIPNRRRKQY